MAEHQRSPEYAKAKALGYKTRRTARELLEVVRDVEFGEEATELLGAELEAAQGMLRLASAALAGDPGTDWDAELAALEHKRQWGLWEREQGR